MERPSNPEAQLASLNKAYHACLEKETASFLANSKEYRLPVGANEFCENEKVAFYTFMKNNFQAEFRNIQDVEKNLFF